MKAPQRTTKYTKAFAQAQGLPSPDPKTWTKEQLHQYEEFLKLKDKKRVAQNYKKRVENGTAPKYIPTSELDPDRHEVRKKQGSKHGGKSYAIRKALGAAAIHHGVLQKSRLNDPGVLVLRDLLARKLSADEIKAIEAKALADLVPKERKAPDDKGYRKPGPVRNADGVQDPETQRHRAMACESANGSYVRARALYEAAHEFAAMQSFDKYAEKIETFRRILRDNHKTEEEIAAIEANALKKYEETHDVQRVPRKEFVSRSIDLLEQFFESYPDVAPVNAVGELSDKDRNLYHRYLRSLDPERFRERDREWEDANRERRYFQCLRRYAEKKQWPFDITEETVKNFMPTPCYYCGRDV